MQVGSAGSHGQRNTQLDPYADWSIDEGLRHVASMELEESFYLPSPATWTGPQDPMTGAYSGEYKFNQAGLDAIKDQLLQGRGVAISFKADQSLPGQAVTGSQYINLDTWAHYTYDGAVMNHAVCIVGYDDTYSKSNFLADHQPPADGAFIVKNSWGSTQSTGNDRNDWGIDGTGYFYLSYYDKSLNYPEAFDFVTPNDDDLTFGKGDDAEVVNEYQYAFMPGDPNAKSYEHVVSSANIYEIGSKSIIRDVAVQTQSQGTDVRYDLYLLDPGATTPTDGELLWSKDVHYPYGGFHRAEIDQPVVANAGDRIGVVVTTTLPSGNYEIQQNRYLSREYVMAIKPNAGEQIWGESVVNPGESFLGSPAQRTEYADGSYAYGNYTWTDLATSLNAGKAEFQRIKDTTEFGPAYTKAIDALNAWMDLRVERDSSSDPDVQALLAEYAQAQAEYAAIAMQPGLVPDDLDAAWFKTDNYPITLTTTAFDESKLPAEAKPVETFRMYNPYTGEHLFTQDASERATLKEAGWDDEGTAWTSPSKSNAPVYRLYNQWSGEHLYTTSRVERDACVGAGWTDEGIGFYSDPAREGYVYRLFNPYEEIGTHHYTQDVKERDAMIRNGWRFEGISWYSQPAK